MAMRAPPFPRIAKWHREFIALLARCTPDTLRFFSYQTAPHY